LTCNKYVFNPLTGNLDLVSANAAGNADNNQICFNYQSGENISALRLITLNLNSEAIVGSATTEELSQIIGIATHSAIIAQSIKVVHSGKFQDPSLDTMGFIVGSCLYLDDMGRISSNPSMQGFHVEIGQYLGDGCILVDIKRSIKLC